MNLNNRSNIKYPKKPVIIPCKHSNPYGLSNINFDLNIFSIASHICDNKSKPTNIIDHLVQPTNINNSDIQSDYNYRIVNQIEVKPKINITSVPSHSTYTSPKSNDLVPLLDKQINLNSISDESDESDESDVLILSNINKKKNITPKCIIS